MPYGMAARGIFGDEVVGKFAAVAAANANHHLASRDLLGAAFSAAHFVRLSGRRSWSDEDQERMSQELRQSVTLNLQAGDAVSAAARAASYQMLTDEAPPVGEAEIEELRKSITALPGQRHGHGRHRPHGLRLRHRGARARLGADVALPGAQGQSLRK